MQVETQAKVIDFSAMTAEERQTLRRVLLAAKARAEVR